MYGDRRKSFCTLILKWLNSDQNVTEFKFNLHAENLEKVSKYQT